MCVHVYPSLIWALARCLISVAVSTLDFSQASSEMFRRPSLNSDKNQKGNWQAVSILYVIGCCVLASSKHSLCDWPLCARPHLLLAIPL